MSNATEQAARWFARLRQREHDEVLQARFEQWLWSDPAHARAYQAVCEAWEGLDDNRQLTQMAAAAGRHRQTRRRVLRNAAGTAGAVLLGGVAWRWLAEQGVEWRGQWQTLAAQTARHALPDGSVLALGPASRADVLYTGTDRRVKLRDGVVALEVVHDAGRPFTVSTELADVTVLGTRFVVDHLSPDHVRVSLAEGSVSVTQYARRWLGLLRTDVAQRTLSPGQVLDVRPEGVFLANIPVEDAYAWQQGALVFSGAGLREIAARMSRYTAMPVLAPEGDGAGAAAPRIIATVRLADLDAFLDSLPELAPVRVRRQDGAIHLLPR